MDLKVSAFHSTLDNSIKANDKKANESVLNDDQNKKIVDDFNTYMKDKEALSSQQKAKELLDDKKANALNSDIFDKKSDMSALFSSLMADQKLTNSINTDTLSVQSTNLSTDNTLSKAVLDGLIDKILVSDPKLSDSHEVRILLSQNSILNGTEIVLRRDIEGILSVFINAKNADQLQRLTGVKKEIITALESNEQKAVRLDLDCMDENNDKHNSYGA